MNKKIYPQAVLKNQPEERQGDIVLYLDGDGSSENPAHSLKSCIAWLAQDGIATSSGALSEFRSWYLLRQQLKANEQAATEMVQEGREQGWLKSAEEELAAGPVAFFSRLAMQQQDNLGFVRILREKTRGEIAKTDREKFEFDAAASALKALPALKQIAGNSKLDENAKINAARGKLFGALPE